MEFLNPAMVEAFGTPLVVARGCTDGMLMVSVYDRLIFKVCPNPNRPDIWTDIEQQYRNGEYSTKSYHYITKNQFQDPAFWNSCGEKL